MSELISKDYSSFLTEIKARIRRGQYQALRAANKELLDLYLDIGESIYRKQESPAFALGVREPSASYGLKISEKFRNDFAFSKNR
jgi:hypothetical protein